MRSKLVSEAHRARAEATAFCAAAFSGTGSCVGFNRMASTLGRSRNMLIKAENSVAAPVPTAPANSSCSADGSGLELSMRDTNSQERGEGKALTASRSKALSNSGRKRMNAMTSGRIPVLIAHSHHSCTSTSKSM